MAKVRLKSVIYGEYLINQFMFKIYVDELSPKVGLTPEVERRLQTSYLHTILHEYIHFVHEVSTYIGTILLLYAVATRAVLSKYVSRDLSSSAFNEIDESDYVKIEIIQNAIGAIFGDNFDDIKNRITSIHSYRFEKTLIEIPIGDNFEKQYLNIPFISFYSGKSVVTKMLGNYFLYEGLAHGLERILFEKNHENSFDINDGTEYTFIIYIAKHIIPDISTYCILTLASLSLSYLECGTQYMTFLEEFANAKLRGISENIFLEELKKICTTEHASRYQTHVEVIEEIEEAYKYRSSLKLAFSDIKARYITSYGYRMKNPTLEVDYIFENDLNGLLNRIPPCDYTYVFKDKNKFMRDISGTSKASGKLGLEISRAMKVYIAHIHYSQILLYENLEIDSQEYEDGMCCPFYTICNLKYRRENAKLCGTKPWEIYDLIYKKDKKFCWYTEGVLQFKGIDIDPTRRN